MRPSVLCLALAITLAVAGCRGDDDDSSVADDAGTGPLPMATDAQVQALTHVAVPGYSILETGTTVLGAAVTYAAEAKTAGGAALFVRTNIAPCDDFICASLDPAEYASDDAQDNLKSVLPAVHKDNPDLLWEFGEVQLSPDATGLYYRALSYTESPSGGGSTARSSANAYRAWYHNGSVYVTFEVFARSAASPLSKADVEKLMTGAEAEKAAGDVFAALEPRFPR